MDVSNRDKDDNFRSNGSESSTTEEVRLNDVEGFARGMVTDAVGPLGQAKVSRGTTADGKDSVIVDYEGGAYSEIVPSSSAEGRFVISHYGKDGDRRGYNSGNLENPDHMSMAFSGMSDVSDPSVIDSVEKIESGPLYASGRDLYRKTESSRGEKFQRLSPGQGWETVDQYALLGSHKAYLDEIERSGRSSGRCAICNRPLEGESATRGIGPKCAAGYTR